MTTTPAYLPAYPSPTVLWTLMNDDKFLVRDVGENVDDIIVTDDELNAHHPQFSRTLRELLRFNRQTKDTGVAYAFEVLSTFAMLTGRYLSFVDVSGLQRTVSHIGAFYPTDKGYWNVIGSTLAVEYFNINGVDYPFAVSALNAVHQVTKEQLDVCYPGWHQRWTLAADLDLPFKDCISHTFMPEKHATAALPGMEL